MPADDVTRILSDLPEEDKRRNCLISLKGQIQNILNDSLNMRKKRRELLCHRITSRLLQEITAAEATEMIRELTEVEIPPITFYVYVVDEDNKLKGVIYRYDSWCRQSQIHRSKNLMTSNLYTVHTDMPQETVARAVARYNLLAIPVDQ